MKALIFGSSGSIGKYIFDHLQIDNIDCIGTTTNENKVNDKTIYVDINNLMIILIHLN
jgi:dTDP-4-dehydrorhamnose reductase